MGRKLSRRSVLSSGLVAAAGVMAMKAPHAEQLETLRATRRAGTTALDPYEALLRRHGGELGGHKARD